MISGTYTIFTPEKEIMKALYFFAFFYLVLVVQGLRHAQLHGNEFITAPKSLVCIKQALENTHKIGVYIELIYKSW